MHLSFFKQATLYNRTKAVLRKCCLATKYYDYETPENLILKLILIVSNAIKSLRTSVWKSLYRRLTLKNHITFMNYDTGQNDENEVRIIFNYLMHVT